MIRRKHVVVAKPVLPRRRDEIGKPVDRAYVFAFVRDPVARFVSAYDQTQTGDLWPFLPEMRAIIDRHGATLEAAAAGLAADSALLQLPWFAPQHTFLEIRGPLAVNRVFKTESFAADLDTLCAEKSIRLRPLTPVNRRGQKCHWQKCRWQYRQWFAGDDAMYTVSPARVRARPPWREPPPPRRVPFPLPPLTQDPRPCDSSRLDHAVRLFAP